MSTQRPSLTPAVDKPPRMAAPDADDGWGSDFDDVHYTDAEMAEFDRRFKQEEAQIRAFNRQFPPPPPPRRPTTR